MDFTREPIIETIITPREGFKLVVRSSKAVAQEEYFVEALEIVSFGQALFFRSLERPKCFMVPVTDYEILEVREARMVLKNVGVDSTIKIGGGREGRVRSPAREPVIKAEPEEPSEKVAKVANGTEARPDKKRERRRHSRRRRGGREDRLEEGKEGEELGDHEEGLVSEGIDSPRPKTSEEPREKRGDNGAFFSSILAPPTQLISETLERYRGDELFRGVFASPNRTDEATPEEIQSELIHSIQELQEIEPLLNDSEARSQRQRGPRVVESEDDIIPPEELHGEFRHDD